MKKRYLGLLAAPMMMAQCQPACTPVDEGPVAEETTVAAPVETTAPPTTAPATTQPPATTLPPAGDWDPVTDPDMFGVSCGVGPTGIKGATLLFHAPDSDHNDYTVSTQRLEGDPLFEQVAWPYEGLNGVPNGRGELIFGMSWPMLDGRPATAMRFSIINPALEPGLDVVVAETHTWDEVMAIEPACNAVWG